MHKLPNDELKEINRRLEDKYGKFDNGFQYFRLVWSGDMFEKRWMTHTNDGFELLQPEVREVPKYFHRDRYVLEGLKEIPIESDTDLITRISYEPVWTFAHEDKPIQPTWYAIHIILETIRQNMEQAGKGEVKYKDPDSNPEEALENQRRKIDEIQLELFGNETPVGDNLAHGSAVGYGPTSQPNSKVRIH